METKTNTAENVNPGADAGTQKTFTQEEVNNIVQERLARERAKSEPTPQELKEKELAAREGKLACMEYIAEKKYPKGLLDLFDTADREQFEQKVEKMKEIFPRLFEDPAKIPVFTRGTSFSGGSSVSTDLIAQAFKRE